jgi:hypothetical protein
MASQLAELRARKFGFGCMDCIGVTSEERGVLDFKHTIQSLHLFILNFDINRTAQ